MIEPIISWIFSSSNTPGHTRTQHLDSWRGIAILAVLFGHFALFPFLNAGRLGVELFFVLSGYLMANLLFVKKTPLPLFFQRRISRVWPTMMVMVTVIMAISHTMAVYPPINWAGFLSTITFTYNYYAIYGERIQVIDHIWSLCIEEHIYILLAVVAVTCRRITTNKAPLVILSALAGAFIVNGWVQSAYGWSYYSVYWRTDTRGASILMGAIAFLAWPMIRQRKWAQSPYLPWVSAIIATILSFQLFPDTLRYSLGTALWALALVSLENSPTALRVLNHRVFLLAGAASFSLYLWQQPFYVLIQGIISRPVLLACAITIGLVSFRLVEQPTRRWLNTHWANSPQ